MIPPSPQRPAYSPPVNLATVNDQEAVAVAPEQPAWERYVKQALAALVIGCGAAVPFLSATEDALAVKVCTIIVAVGAGLGITSTGNTPAPRK